MKIICLFFSAPLFLAGTFFASEKRTFDTEKYLHIVESTEEGKRGNITLSDGSRWHLSHKNFSATSVPIPKGTEVFIRGALAEDPQVEFLMKYSLGAIEREIQVEMSGETLGSLETLKAKHKICVKDGWWFSASDYIEVWELSDGSKWTIKNEKHGYKKNDRWELGDPVFVSAAIGSNHTSWWLINPKERLLFPVSQGEIDFGFFTKLSIGMPLEMIIEPYDGAL